MPNKRSATEDRAAADKLTDAPIAAPAGWSLDAAGELYGIHQWGQGYFSINEKGHVVVRPDKRAEREVDLKQLVDDLRKRDVQPPLLIRFSDILSHRLAELAEVFKTAITENEYQGGYRCVYPIKVNQQRHVVEEIQAFGQAHGFGLEAGSKPELLAVMAMVQDDETPIVCNGFKDAQFIEAVILATKIGKNIIPVVEKYSELKLIVRYAKLHNVKPKIGIRVKLSARGAGRWEQSGGPRSKFGLFVSEVVEAVDYLRSENMLDCLNLVHFHLGSQINNIRNIKSAIIELMRVYVEIHRMGAGLQYVDVGGGLGVDYDGSKTNFASSINYSLQEYANDVIYHVKETCDAAGVPHPTVISESGRAMVAYHSVLVFNVLGWSGFDKFELPDRPSDDERAKLPKAIQMLFDCFHEISEKNLHEYYHDAQLARDEVLHLFNLGYCTLELRGLAERLYYGVCSKVLAIVRTLPYVPEEFEGLEAGLSDTYFCNYSIFQSMPDAWAIDQLFPIMPIHRLEQEPTCQGIIADITCDSDGKIDQFIGEQDVKPVLELHPYSQGDDYYLATFLVGAYQEILGDLHNLLGDTNAVHVSIDEQGEVEIEEIVEGDTVTEVLRYVQFDTEDLRRNFRKSVEQALRQKKLTLEESRVLRRFYEDGLQGYTYLT
ncbi:biosynthetic arginine decarboxylase [Phycisphaerales bacterium AB-hyl4]|uniref:Biosynthetic arginine decarboxylase n=1 Tax=Natronomicrosphaera hydrolytica TaxID=3242702 RepID=A0ABV4U0K4_9BACT